MSVPVPPVQPRNEPARPGQAEILTFMDLIEQALHAADLATAQPSAEALASSAPFCFDTLEFHAWLQWVFLPRMRYTVIGSRSLSARCSITPLAEHQLADHPQNTDDLIALLAEFDVLANRYFDFPDEATP